MPVALANGGADTPGPAGPSRQLRIGGRYSINKQNAPSGKITVLQLRTGSNGVAEAYISYDGADKRLDTWIPQSQVGQELTPATPPRLSRAENSDSTIAGPSSESLKIAQSAPSTPEREHAAMTGARNFEDVRFGEYLIETWFYSPYPLLDDHKDNSKDGKKKKVDNPSSTNERHLSRTHSRSAGEMFAGLAKSGGGEGARGRLWVCDLCFKYMRTRAAWTRHCATCDLLTPPGRKVYQRGSYRIWEVDGAQAGLYCQNLSLFGKLFIDQKSVFFHVENFLFYVVCDASTSRRDQVMAFFSKEKVSYDDYNLACIITFPPCQNRGFGKLLIEFSYYLTKHPSTKFSSGSPGTPERPLSDLGLKGYTAFWTSTVLRGLRRLLKDAPPLATTPIKEGRVTRERRIATVIGEVETVDIDRTVTVTKVNIPTHKGQYAISTTLSDLSKACHLRINDTAYTLSELGFLQHRRDPIVLPKPKRRRVIHDVSALGDRESTEGSGTVGAGAGEDDEGEDDDAGGELGEWENVEVVITRGMVDEMWAKWGVRDKPVLDESCVLL